MAPSSNLKQNQNGGYYENGKSLPLPVRYDIVQRHLRGERVTRIARDLLLTHGVVSKIVRNYNKTGSWLPQNIRFAGDVNLPQPVPMPSTSADVSVPTPMPEPDVVMANPVATTVAKPANNFTVDALLQTPAAPPNPTLAPVTTDEPMAPALPFSISSILSQPPPPEPASLPKWPHVTPPPTYETVQIIPPPEAFLQLQIVAMQTALLSTFK